MDTLILGLPEIGDVIAHIDPEYDNASGADSKLPLRSVIEAEIITSLQSLRHNIDARFSLRPQNTVVHYLDKGCRVEAWMSMLDGVTTRYRSWVSSRVQEKLMLIGNISGSSVFLSKFKWR